jgi:hypothetical protein
MSVLTPDDLALRDLKPQAEIGSATPAFVVPVIIGATVGLLLVLGLLVWRVKRRVPEPELADVFASEEMGPEDSARVLLDGAGAAFAAGQDYVAYYSTIAITVRNYLTDRYGFPAFALTTTELQDRMVGQGMDRWQARLVGGLLSQCDTVVFAHYRPAMERADADLTAAYEIVEMSRPQAEPELEEAGVR